MGTYFVEHLQTAASRANKISGPEKIMNVFMVFTLYKIYRSIILPMLIILSGSTWIF